MFFVGCIFFSEMASRKWIVLFAFLVLFTFMVEVRSSSVSLEEVIQLLQKSVTALKTCNYNCTGKSPNTILISGNRPVHLSRLFFQNKKFVEQSNIVFGLFLGVFIFLSVYELFY